MVRLQLDYSLNLCSLVELKAKEKSRYTTLAFVATPTDPTFIDLLISAVQETVGRDKLSSVRIQTVINS